MLGAEQAAGVGHALHTLWPPKVSSWFLLHRNESRLVYADMQQKTLVSRSLMELAASKALKALKQLGASIELADGKVTSVRFDETNRKPTGADLLCLQHLKDLRDIDFFDTLVDTDVLNSVATLPALESLNLNCTAIDDKAMDAIAQLKALRQLELMDTSVSDKSKASLAGFTELTSLRIDGTRITAATIEPLISCRPLNTLWLDGKQASPTCMKALAAHVHLRNLSLVGAEVTNKTIAPLQASQNLQRLALLRSSVTSEGLGVLAALPSLEELTLNGSAGISDVAIDVIKHMRALRKLWLFDTAVTPAGLASFANALPGVTIRPVRRGRNRG